MIHKGRLADDDLQQCVMAIRKNTVECMQGVLRAMDTLQISLGLAENAPRKKVGCGVWGVGCGMDSAAPTGRFLFCCLGSSELLNDNLRPTMPDCRVVSYFAGPYWLAWSGLYGVLR